MKDNAGAVDDDIKATKNTDCLGHDQFALLPTGYVARNKRKAASGFFAALLDGASAILVATGNDHPGPRLDKGNCGSLADARGTAGNQYALIAEIKLGGGRAHPKLGGSRSGNRFQLQKFHQPPFAFLTTITGLLVTTKRCIAGTTDIVDRDLPRAQSPGYHLGPLGFG